MLVKKLISAGFRLLKNFLVDRIQHDNLKNAITRLLTPVEEVSVLLTDSNPNNAAQFEEFWQKNKSRLSDIGLDGMKIWVEAKVKDATLRQTILEILNSLDNEGNIVVVAQ